MDDKEEKIRAQLDGYLFTTLIEVFEGMPEEHFNILLPKLDHYLIEHLREYAEEKLAERLAEILVDEIHPGVNKTKERYEKMGITYIHAVGEEENRREAKRIANLWLSGRLKKWRWGPISGYVKDS